MHTIENVKKYSHIYGIFYNMQNFLSYSFFFLKLRQQGVCLRPLGLLGTSSFNFAFLWYCICVFEKKIDMNWKWINCNFHQIVSTYPLKLKSLRLDKGRNISASSSNSWWFLFRLCGKEVGEILNVKLYRVFGRTISWTNLAWQSKLRHSLQRFVWNSNNWWAGWNLESCHAVPFNTSGNCIKLYHFLQQFSFFYTPS